MRGFLDMLATLIRTRRPDRLVCALDADWRPAWRVALLPSYKAHRVAYGDREVVPDGLERQVPLILEVLAAVGIPAVGVAGYEADDVLGTLAATQPGPVEVVSGDRDLFQLVDDDAAGAAALLRARRGQAGGVRRRGGARPSTACRPPATPTSPRCAATPATACRAWPGVGEKTAARLIDRYGSLDGILAALDDPAAGFAPGLRTKLIAAKDYLAVAPTVVRVALDVPLPELDPALPPLAGRPGARCWRWPSGGIWPAPAAAWSTPSPPEPASAARCRLPAPSTCSLCRRIKATCRLCRRAAS